MTIATRPVRTDVQRTVLDVVAANRAHAAKMYADADALVLRSDAALLRAAADVAFDAGRAHFELDLDYDGSASIRVGNARHIPGWTVELTEALDNLSFSDMYSAVPRECFAEIDHAIGLVRVSSTITRSAITPTGRITKGHRA